MLDMLSSFNWYYLVITRKWDGRKIVPRNEIQEPGERPPLLKDVHICRGPNYKAKDPILDFSINNLASVKLIMTSLYSDSFFVSIMCCFILRHFLTVWSSAIMNLQMWNCLLLASYWFACLHCNTMVHTGSASFSLQLWSHGFYV